MSKPAISVQKLYKIFGHDTSRAMRLMNDGLSNEEILEKTKCGIGVADANFDVYPGEILVVMGLSGSGKSTLLRCINRMIAPTSGKVLLDDIDIAKVSDEELREMRRNKFGMVFQRFALFPHKTVLENAAFGLAVKKLPKEQQRKSAQEALNLVGLEGWGSSYPDQLSGGMQQRVGLARALAINPDILLMDEPFGALDPLIRKEMQDELIEMQSKMQKTILFITHDLDEALKMGDRVVLMKDGRIVQIGTPEEILKSPENLYVKKFVENVDFTKVLTAADVMVKPKEVGFIKDGPLTLLHKMRVMGSDGVFIVDNEHKLLGYVTAEKAGACEKEGREDIKDIIEEYNKQKVSVDEQVRNLFSVIVDNRYPVAVVDENNVLKGQLVKGSIIAGLAESKFHV
ncbi:MAG: quaternary amine ABC transporter ATP-binding protein [Elusimicrobiota bacterium]